MPSSSIPNKAALPTGSSLPNSDSQSTSKQMISQKPNNKRKRTPSLEPNPHNDLLNAFSFQSEEDEEEVLHPRKRSRRISALNNRTLPKTLNDGISDQKSRFQVVTRSKLAPLSTQPLPNSPVHTQPTQGSDGKATPVGEYVLKDGLRLYSGFMMGGVEYSVGDSVNLFGEHRELNWSCLISKVFTKDESFVDYSFRVPEKTERTNMEEWERYVEKVKELMGTLKEIKVGELYFEGKWYWTPDDVNYDNGRVGLIRYHEWSRFELIMSDQVDLNHVGCVRRKIRVVNRGRFEKWAREKKKEWRMNRGKKGGDSSSSSMVVGMKKCAPGGEEIYYCERVYYARLKVVRTTVEWEIPLDQLEEEEREDAERMKRIEEEEEREREKWNKSVEQKRMKLRESREKVRDAFVAESRIFGNGSGGDTQDKILQFDQTVMLKRSSRPLAKKSLPKKNQVARKSVELPTSTSRTEQRKTKSAKKCAGVEATSRITASRKEATAVDYDTDLGSSPKKTKIPISARTKPNWVHGSHRNSKRKKSSMNASPTPNTVVASQVEQYVIKSSTKNPYKEGSRSYLSDVPRPSVIMKKPASEIGTTLQRTPKASKRTKLVSWLSPAIPHRAAGISVHTKVLPSPSSPASCKTPQLSIHTKHSSSPSTIAARPLPRTKSAPATKPLPASKSTPPVRSTSAALKASPAKVASPAKFVSAAKGVPAAKRPPAAKNVSIAEGPRAVNATSPANVAPAAKGMSPVKASAVATATPVQPAASAVKFVSSTQAESTTQKTVSRPGATASLRPSNSCWVVGIARLPVRGVD